MANWLVRVGTTAAMFALPLSAQTSRDSAGVRIVENTRPVWRDNERLSLTANPHLVFGNDTDSAYRFRQVRAVMRLTDGRIAVADGGTLQLRIFSADGRFLSASAGKGAAPGQIFNMQWVRRLRGDTIVISAGFSTLALFSGTGQFVRMSTLPPRAQPGPDGRFMLIAVLDNGVAVAAPYPRPASRPIGSRWTESIALKLVTASDTSVRDFGVVPYIEVQQESAGPRPVWLSAIGVFAAHDDRFYAGYGDRYAIRVYTSDGKLRSIIRRSWTPAPITPANWETWVVEWSKLWVTTTGAERERDIQDARDDPYAFELPAFSQFIVDAGGRLWVRGAHWEDAIGAGSLTDRPAVPSTWSVFDVGGRWLGDVGMPAHFQPFEIGTNYVTGVRRADGVTQVVIYELSARGR